MSLKAGKEALAQKRYTEAIAILSQYCAAQYRGEDHHKQTRDYIHAQMWLVSAYQHIGRADKAITICEQFIDHDDPQVQSWAKQALKKAELNLEGVTPPPVTAVVKSKPNRYRKNRVTLSIKPSAQLLFRLSMLGTIGLILGIIFAFCLGIIYLITPTLTTGWLYVAIGTTVIASIILFFMSPWLIDITHKQFYRVQWITLADLDPKAPEAVAVIEEFCQARKIFVPKIGWIEDRSPVAFIYGVLPNSTRLILSRGLFTTLDDDEIAAVVAQQLGHVANWSFAVVSAIAAPSQLIYLCHVIITRIGFKLKVGNYFWHLCAAIPQYLYRFTTYLAFGVTRSSAYMCDRFAAEATGNPNALSRALAKMARDTQTPSRLLESSVNFSPIDYRTSTSVGMVFQILYAGYSEVSKENLYKVFLWELFNPWAVWTELHSPQPLIGRRIKALTAYAHQLGLTEEYEFSQLLIAEKTLNFKLLYKNFLRDLVIETAPHTFMAIALITSAGFYWLYNNWLLPSLVAIAWGLGIMLKGSLKYPDYNKVTATNLVNLLIDPYVSPLRGKPVQVPGELVGYSINDLPDYDLRLEDQSAILPLHYMPNVRTFFTDSTPIQTKLENLVGETVLTTGWFRRGNGPSFDVSVLQPISGDRHHLPLKSYHQLWNNLLSSVTVLGGLGLLAVSSLF